MSEEETFCFFETWRPGWCSNQRSLTFQALTTAPASPPLPNQVILYLFVKSLKTVNLFTIINGYDNEMIFIVLCVIVNHMSFTGTQEVTYEG